MHGHAQPGARPKTSRYRRSSQAFNGGVSRRSSLPLSSDASPRRYRCLRPNQDRRPENGQHFAAVRLDPVPQVAECIRLARLHTPAARANLRVQFWGQGYLDPHHHGGAITISLPAESNGCSSGRMGAFQSVQIVRALHRLSIPAGAFRLGANGAASGARPVLRWASVSVIKQSPTQEGTGRSAGNDVGRSRPPQSVRRFSG